MQRLRTLLPGVWAGVLLCVALLATPAPFATLASADAGRVVSHIFLREAYLGLAMSMALILLHRGRRGSELWLSFGTLFCTIAGYFAVQPMMAAARAGDGRFSFGQLHAASFGLFGLKMLLVLVLAWRAARPPAPAASTTRRPS